MIIYLCVLLLFMHNCSNNPSYLREITVNMESPYSISRRNHTILVQTKWPKLKDTECNIISYKEAGQNLKFFVSSDSTSLNLLSSVDQKHPNAFT